jgi:hypothetical protein
VTSGRTPPGTAEILARWTANDAGKPGDTSSIEVLDPLTEDDIRPAHDAPTGQLEPAAEKVRAGKE